VATNPAWAVDELILAFDLYERRRPQLPNRDDADVVDLSRVLNALPIHTTRPDEERFRSPSGVAMKLANFAALDPTRSGKGLDAGSRLDAVVFDRYHDDADTLRLLAAQLREGAKDPGMFPMTPEADEEELSAVEGRLLYRLHRSRERSSELVHQKKAQALSRGNALQCEACGFDFAERYGELGAGFIECHHIVPLAELGHARVRLADLSLLCANCHRMIHRARQWMSLADLRATMAPQRVS
jgi:5-methylcytosine-specific restriction protein A